MAFDDSDRTLTDTEHMTSRRTQSALKCLSGSRTQATNSACPRKQEGRSEASTPAFVGPQEAVHVQSLAHSGFLVRGWHRYGILYPSTGTGRSFLSNRSFNLSTLVNCLQQTRDSRWAHEPPAPELSKASMNPEHTSWLLLMVNCRE